MPLWAEDGIYNIRCGGKVPDSPVSATFEYEKPKEEITIESIESAETVVVRGKIYGGIKAISCLVTDENNKIAYVGQTESDSDGNFTFEFNMPLWAETGIYSVRCGGEVPDSPVSATFEYIKNTVEENETSIEISSAVIDENGSITVLGTSLNLSGQISYVLTDESNNEISTGEIETNANGDFSLKITLPVWSETGTYVIELAFGTLSAKTSLTYNKPEITIEEIDISKAENRAIYDALKAECKFLDDDNDGVINASELKSISGCLDLSNRNISDISGLQALSGVTDLYLSNNKIQNIDVLSNLTNLQRLDVSNNEISSLDNVPENLTALHIENNNITYAEILGRCRKMIYLFADNNGILDIEFVKLMPSLTTLSMEKNNIQDITWLKNCTKLRYLNLSDNKIEDITALSNCPDLYDLRLSNNSVTDISALPNKLFFTVYIDGNNISIAQKTALNSIVKKY